MGRLRQLSSTIFSGYERWSGDISKTTKTNGREGVLQSNFNFIFNEMNDWMNILMLIYYVYKTR